jgi:uncharacterized protein YkwD
MTTTIVLCVTAMLLGADLEAKQEPNKSEKDLELIQVEKNIFHLTNLERTKHGLEPLEVSPDLMKSARRHGAWMARNRNMVHRSGPYAENIAMGYKHSSVAVRAWMNSSGHRANILSSRHRRIGVSAYRTQSGTIYWCQQFRK